MPQQRRARGALRYSYVDRRAGGGRAGGAATAHVLRGAASCRVGGMRAETKLQLAIAVVGIPVMVLVVWKPNAKWPNPFHPSQK